MPPTPPPTPTDADIDRLLRSLDAYKEMSGVLKDHYTVSEQKLQVAQMESQIASKTLDARQAELKTAQESGSLTEAEIENLSTQLATMRLLVKEKATMLQLQEDSHAAAGNVANELREALGITQTWRKELTGGFELAMREHGGLLGAMKAVTGEMMAQITFADILGSTNQKLEFGILALIGAGIAQAFMFDQAISDFKTATGASDKYASSIQNTWEQTRFYGVSIEDATKATQALYETYTDFTMLNSSSHVALSRKLKEVWQVLRWILGLLLRKWQKASMPQHQPWRNLQLMQCKHLRTWHSPQREQGWKFLILCHLQQNLTPLRAPPHRLAS